MITVDKSKCAGCGKCVDACPTRALYLIDQEVFIREGLCRGCGACVEVCPKGAILLNASPPLGPRILKQPVRPPLVPPGTGRVIGGRGGRHRFGRRRR